MPSLFPLSSAFPLFSPRPSFPHALIVCGGRGAAAVHPSQHVLCLRVNVPVPAPCPPLPLYVLVTQTNRAGIHVGVAVSVTVGHSNSALLSTTRSSCEAGLGPAIAIVRKQTACRGRWRGQMPNRTQQHTKLTPYTQSTTQVLG